MRQNPGSDSSLRWDEHLAQSQAPIAFKKRLGILYYL